MKTKAPFNFYFLLIITVLFFVYLLPGSLLRMLFYLLIGLTLIYILFCRDGCRIELDDFEIRIKYIFPWDKDVTIRLDDISEVDYAKGYYDIFADKTIGSGLFSFPFYCYDRLIFKLEGNKEDETLFVNVNTRAFEFDKLFKQLHLKIFRNSAGL